jgi:hypothetical protein
VRHSKHGRTGGGCTGDWFWVKCAAGQIVSTIAVLGVAATPAVCQSTFFFEVSNVITPEQPSATVTLWATFDPQWFAFHRTLTDVFSEFDRGWFSDPLFLLDDPEGSSNAGEVSPDGDRVSGIFVTQLHIPFNHFPDPSNPIPIWSAMWTTDDFTPRQVDLATESQSFWVWHEDGGRFDMFGVDFAEGSGFIEVVPSPGGAAALLMAWAMAGRRRRAAGR